MKNRLNENEKEILKNLSRYFWDIDYKKLDFDKGKVFIIKRVVEYGDDKDMNFLIEMYGVKDIKKVICSYRFSPKSAGYWALKFGINKKEVLCLKERLTQKQKMLWNY
jgi:hypothetical protein